MIEVKQTNWPSELVTVLYQLKTETTVMLCAFNVHHFLP